MLRTAILTVGLFVLWLSLSGIYTPLILTLGAISCLLTMVIVRRMRIIDNDSLVAQISIIALMRYLGWLLVEIARANWAVTRTIFSPKLDIQQSLFNVPTSQSTDICKVIYANSITLTPGTITVETEPGYFVTHALTKKAADMDALADMDQRVTNIERRSGST